LGTVLPSSCVQIRARLGLLGDGDAAGDFVEILAPEIGPKIHFQFLKRGRFIPKKKPPSGPGRLKGRGNEWVLGEVRKVDAGDGGKEAGRIPVRRHHVTAFPASKRPKFVYIFFRENKLEQGSEDDVLEAILSWFGE